VPLRLRSTAGEVAFTSTVTDLGTPLELTLAEPAIEAFFPADEATAEADRRAADGAIPPRKKRHAVEMSGARGSS
jgi:hypothetical protein